MENELQFIIYNTAQDNVYVHVVMKDETIWATQKAMAELFGVQVPTISKHLKNIYAEGELVENSTISKMENVVNRGFRGEVKEQVDYYNLDIFNKTQKIISDFDLEMKKLCENS